MRLASASYLRGRFSLRSIQYLHLSAPTLGLVCILLLGAELLLRIPQVRAFLPVPNPYYQAGVEARLLALREVQRRHKDIDALFIGSSIIRTNVRPLLFDEELGADAISFNGGFSALSPDPTAFYLEHFWLKHSSPKVIVQGIRLSELEGSTTAQGFEAFQHGGFESLWLSKSWWSKLELFLMEHLQIFYYRRTLSKYLTDPWWPPNSPGGYPIDSRGWNATERKLQDVLDLKLIEPTTGYTGTISSERFAVGIQALRRAVAISRKAGIEYVLVNVPEHSDKYLAQPDGAKRYADYIRLLQEFAEQEQIRFIDVTDGELSFYQNDDFFSDYHHMSPMGAEVFTRQLAARW